MPVKDLGYYEGVVEEVPKDITKMDKTHIQLIYWNKQKQEAQKLLDISNEQINKIKEEIKPDIENGLIDWAWTWVKTRTNVKWKEEFEKYLGKQKIHEVMSKYKPTEYPQIGIKYIDPIPETVKIKPDKKPISNVHKFKRLLKKKNVC